MIVGLSGTAHAGSIEIIGGSSAALINADTLDYILIDDGATVSGDVTNDSAGTITGTDGNSAIGLYNGSIIEGVLLNRGSIGTVGLGNYAIEIRDSEVTGGLRNEGDLASADTAVVIDLSSGSFSGGITTSGDITAGSEGIDFAGESLTGGITNSGNITSALAGISVYISAGTTGDGSLVGGIVNSGSIRSEDNAALRVVADTLIGGVSNAGSITTANDAGIDLNIATISDGLSNAGTIVSGGTGIAIVGDSVDGGFTNAGAGSITSAAGDAIGVAVDTFAGDILNSGSLTATAGNGLSIDVGRFSGVGSYTGDIINAGPIQAEASGIAIGSNAVVAGRIRNDAGGSIVAGIAIDLAGGSASGAITNAGTIDAEVAISVATDAVSGAVANTGALTGDLWIAGSTDSGDGIDLINSGSIDLGLPVSYASLISGDFAQAGSGSLAMTLPSFADAAGLPLLTVLGDVDISGDLLLGFDTGFSYAPFERLTLIDVGGTRTGLFDNYANDALVQSFGGRQGVYIEYTTEGDIVLYATPLPPTWLLIGTGLLGWHRLRRRGGLLTLERGGGFR